MRRRGGRERLSVKSYLLLGEEEEAYAEGAKDAQRALRKMGFGWKRVEGLKRID